MDIGLFIAQVPKVLYYCFIIRWLNNYGDYYLILIGWFINLNLKHFPVLTVIYRRGDFVYHHLGCTSM